MRSRGARAAPGAMLADEPRMVDLRGPVLDARGVRHLLNRFAFGAPPAAFERLVGLRAAQVLDALLPDTPLPPPRELVRIRWEDYGCDKDGNEVPSPQLAALGPAEQVEHRVALRALDKMQMREYLDDWIVGMVEGRDPLRDRMTLFWHGFFPTRVGATLRRYELIRQHEMLRRFALGSFRDLLHAIVRDAAMLSQFDNDTNVAGRANESFARALMELYSLGEGNYDEHDVREAARALTGYQGVSGEFVFDRSAHDAGEKVIFGRRGRFDGDGLVTLLLEHPACARYVSRRLLQWMEGVAPDAERVQRYADVLLAADYELLPWLRALAADPAFYRAEVVGTRVMAPVELLVSAYRRLELHLDPGFVYFAAVRLGQHLYAHPSVKGWEEGEAWVTSERLLQRDDTFGLMLDVLRFELSEERPELTEEPLEHLVRYTHADRLETPDLVAVLRMWLPRSASDEEIAEYALGAWLAREPDAATRTFARRRLVRLRWAADLPEGPLFSLGGQVREEVALVVRRYAHSLLSLPIAQLH